MGTHFPYDGIIKQPLAQLRQKAAASFARKRLDRDFNSITASIEALLQKNAPDALEGFRAEKKKAAQAMISGQAPDDARLDRPELQLLWGATLGVVALKWTDPDTSVKDSPLWKELESKDVMEEERRFCAQVISSIPGLRERQGSLKVEWGAPIRGYPDLGFYCDPATSTVNLDMAWTLIMGIEPARSLMLREAAHGLGTLYFTDDMNRVRNEMMAIKKEDVRTEEEHIRMIHLAAQWLARYDVTLEAENNFASRFAADRSQVSAQDYAASLNYAETVVGGIADAAAQAKIPVQPPVAAKHRLNNVLRALHFSFFKNNGLFDDSVEGWQSVGVRPEWIETSDGAKKGVEALKELAEMCKEMEDLQPSVRDRAAGDSWHARKMEEMSRERGKVADRIFARFASHMMPELELDAEKNPNDVMDRLEQLTGEPQDGEPSDDNDGEEGPDGEAKDKDTAEVKDKGKTRDARVPPKNPREAKGLPEEGEPQPGEGEGEPEPGEGEGEGEPQPGEGEGDGDGDGDGEGDGDGDGDGDGEEKDSEAEDDLKDGDPKEGEGGRQHGKSGTDEEPELEEDGSYNEYLKIIAPHRELINKTSQLMKQMQEKLRIAVQDPSKQNSLVPEDGDVGRFQPDAMQDRLVKQFSGQSIDESDFETFRVDGPIRYISPPTEIQIWIDGSGSMSGMPVETAITAGCILYEAAKEAGMEVYVTMLGDPHPLPIARPGMSDKEIGRAISSVREGQGGDKDYLAATIAEMVNNTLKKKKGLSDPVGNTHAFVISDGMFTDEKLALEHVKSVNDNAPHATMDFVLINARGGLQIERLADELNKRAKRPAIGYKEIPGYEQISDGLMELLNKRLKAVRAEDAIPLAQKQKEFKNIKLQKKYTNRRGL